MIMNVKTGILLAVWGFFIIFVLDFVEIHKERFEKDNKKSCYYIKTEVDRGGAATYTVGYDSVIGFGYWHEDVFRTMGEAEYNLKTHHKACNHKSL